MDYALLANSVRYETLVKGCEIASAGGSVAILETLMSALTRRFLPKNVRKAVMASLHSSVGNRQWFVAKFLVDFLEDTAGEPAVPASPEEILENITGLFRKDSEGDFSFTDSITNSEFRLSSCITDTDK